MSSPAAWVPTSAEDALRWLQEHGAPRWLVRHHELVLEATDELLDDLREWVLGEAPLGLAQWRGSSPKTPRKRVRVDESRVRLGAALHDAGKTLHPEEMSHPGHAHEAAGEAWLLRLGFPPDIARICVTHARWDAPHAELEDRLVALADKLWKGKRDETLERALVTELAERAGVDAWECFDRFDASCERIASRGDERLARSEV